MDTAMRDLEHIQERGEDDSPGRKAAMLGMAGLSTVALVFAMGVVLGGNNEPTDEERDDPLAALAAVMPTEPPADTAEGAAPSTANDEGQLAAGEVNFHGQLTDERPEVEAALAAAAAEERMLDARAANGTTASAAGFEVPTTAYAPTTAPVANTPRAQTSLGTAPAGDIARVPTTMAIGDSRPVAAGHEGAYTLQVASYRTQEEATVFAEALRARGHAAYTTRAELPGRGTYFRVRVGPFESRVAADRYRNTFEREEAMNSYVVDTARVAAQTAAAAQD